MPSILTDLTLVLVAGIASQWAAWRLRLPAILVLLVVGVVVGPVTGLVRPDELFGDLLMPLVSLSVGLILFEGGLSLKFSEISSTGHAVRNLVTVGAAVTLGLTAVAVHELLGWAWGPALLFGAILTVTGPTVIAPLLRLVKPRRQVASVLKWEGIVIDPIGAMLAVLVFEAIVIDAGGDDGHAGGAAWAIAVLSLRMVAVGLAIGAAGAGLVALLLRRYWIPDYLHNPFTLMTVVAAFAAADSLQHEAGLFAVTFMGLILANLPGIRIGHILEFKENLRVLLISILFIVLSARLDREALLAIPWTGAALVLACLVLVIRPAAVFASTIGSPLTITERVFIGTVAPRGIVAAAVAALFATRLEQRDIAGADQLVPVVFFVIVGTVALYGLGAGPLARRLGIASQGTNGCLLAGAHPFARAFAKALAGEGFRSVLIDTNRGHIATAKLDGLETRFGSILSDEIEEEIDLLGIGNLVALTPNEEVNSLACLHFRHLFGRERCFHLAADEDPGRRDEAVAPELKGRVLFRRPITYEEITGRFERDHWTVRKTRLTETFGWEDFVAHHGEEAIPLARITSGGRLVIQAADSDTAPMTAGDTVVSLVPPVKADTDAAPPSPPPSVNGEGPVA